MVMITIMDVVVVIINSSSSNITIITGLGWEKLDEQCSELARIVVLLLLLVGDDDGSNRWEELYKHSDNSNVLKV